MFQPSPNTLECSLCPRRCRLRPGQRGFCFIRQNSGDEIVNTSFGLTTGVAVDPIEKKPLYHFYPKSHALSFGTLGCNMGCLFCQNSHISKNREAGVLGASLPPQKVGALATYYNCKCVAFTYNDPIIWSDYAVKSAEICHESGLKTIAVTAGYILPEPRKEFFAHMDAANIDLKAFSSHFYQKYCQADINHILDTILYVKNNTNCWLELTTLLIPGLNDSDQELIALTQWIHKELGADVPLHFSAFHPAYRLKDLPSTPPQTLFKARAIAIAQGLHHVYTGNIAHPESQSTYCPKCGTVLIERSWNKTDLKELDTATGTCRKCTCKLAGLF